MASACTMPALAGGTAPGMARRLPRWARWVLALAIVLIYVGLLAGYRLSEPDEARYAEIPREMLELGDWVTPHLNYVKYFEKPPLVYWLTATTFKVLGISEGAARLWPALFGLIGIAIAWLLGRSMYDAWTGDTAAALLAASPFYFGLSQVLTLDMPLTGLMTIALGAFWFAYHSPRYRRLGVLVLYGATALAVLTKGPVAAVLNGGIVVAFLLLRREWTASRWVLSPAAVLLFALIALPWFILVSQRNPEFLHFFIYDQHVKRFLNPNEHQQGVSFFVPIVFGGMLPWTLFALFAPDMLRRFVARLLRGRVADGTLFCALWSGVVFAFFSLSGSKLATYVLPMFCPMAILLARFFKHMVEKDDAVVLRRGAATLLALVAIAVLAGIVAGIVIDRPQIGVILPRLYVGMAALAVTLGIALVALRRGAHQASVLILFVGMLLLQPIAISGRTMVAHYPLLGLAIREQARPEDQVILYNHYVQGIPFYAGRRFVVVGGHGELHFGSRQGDQSAFFWKDDAALLEAWRSSRRVFLVINRGELDPLMERLAPAPRQIAAQGKKVLIVNFPG
ncbi:MAG: glycosyltransferase family 39 protein [Candidatus Binatia bacterium]